MAAFTTGDIQCKATPAVDRSDCFNDELRIFAVITPLRANQLSLPAELEYAGFVSARQS